MRIPITMCHGISDGGDYPLAENHFAALIAIAAELGFHSINYDQLAAWRAGTDELPERPIMFDFDHPVKSMRYAVHDILAQHGFAGNLFVNTGPMAPDAEGYGTQTMTWDELAQLHDLGWHIGAHTVTHPNLSELSKEDPSGEKLAAELADCDATLERRLGLVPRDFAFTGTSWSSAAEQQVMQRYRFGRLWIIGALYQADGQQIRYADLVGVEGTDEADGGPPAAARYITRETPAYRLPSMEFQSPLLHGKVAFHTYLEGALD
ncbi:MAG: polysaccharide deacetylase family protein [Candidatus Latescibacteria bacterium]|nr:polysaccharide deacetylase family protein [Candidatus Latescibacterota bacterium]